MVATHTVAEVCDAPVPVVPTGQGRASPKPGQYFALVQAAQALPLTYIPAPQVTQEATEVAPWAL